METTTPVVEMEETQVICNGPVNLETVMKVANIFGPNSIENTDNTIKINYTNPISHYLAFDQKFILNNGSLVQFNTKIIPKKFETDFQTIFNLTLKERVQWYG